MQLGVVIITGTKERFTWKRSVLIVDRVRELKVDTRRPTNFTPTEEGGIPSLVVKSFKFEETSEGTICLFFSFRGHKTYRGPPDTRKVAGLRSPNKNSKESRQEVSGHS